MPHRWHALLLEAARSIYGHDYSAPVVADKVARRSCSGLLGKRGRTIDAQAVLVGNPARLFGF